MSDAATASGVLEDAARWSVRERGTTLGTALRTPSARRTTLGTALTRIGVENSTDLSKKELFHVLDRDGNGCLDLQEFDRLYDTIRAQTKRELWEKTRSQQTGDSLPCSPQTVPTCCIQAPLPRPAGHQLRLAVAALVALVSTLIAGNAGLVYGVLVATKEMFVKQTPGEGTNIQARGGRYPPSPPPFSHQRPRPHHTNTLTLPSPFCHRRARDCAFHARTYH